MSTSVETGQRATVELRMDARPENLSYARLALAGIGAGAGAPREVVSDLKLAVTEACANAMQHAYLGAGSGEEILVRFSLHDGALAVEVQDFGLGFAAGPQRADLWEEFNNLGYPDERGMGLLIISAVTDELTISSSSAGSRVAFVRRFSPEH